ncbi:hypothetical protein LR68_02637 [Anoxybacillus sp. BCO1]|nr:hypothetical protein LR68_02637 [Anoxybacillus sp. BCO1]
MFVKRFLYKLVRVRNAWIFTTKSNGSSSNSSGCPPHTRRMPSASSSRLCCSLGSFRSLTTTSAPSSRSRFAAAHPLFAKPNTNTFFPLYIIPTPQYKFLRWQIVSLPSKTSQQRAIQTSRLIRNDDEAGSCEIRVCLSF